MTKEVSNKCLFIEMILKYKEILYQTPVTSQAMGLKRINFFIKQPYEQIAKRDLINTLIPSKFRKNDLISSFLEINPQSKIISNIETSEQSNLGFITELGTVDLLSTYSNVVAICVKSDKLKNASPENIKKSLATTNQRMGDFYIKLDNQHKYFDVKHGNLNITNLNHLQEFSTSLF